MLDKLGSAPYDSVPKYQVWLGLGLLLVGASLCLLELKEVGSHYSKFVSDRTLTQAKIPVLEKHVAELQGFFKVEEARPDKLRSPQVMLNALEKKQLQETELAEARGIKEQSSSLYLGNMCFSIIKLLLLLYIMFYSMKLADVGFKRWVKDQLPQDELARKKALADIRKLDEEEAERLSAQSSDKS